MTEPTPAGANMGASAAAAPAGGVTPGGTGGDALDKGVSSILGKSGHAQSGSTTEKISDGIRS